MGRLYFASIDIATGTGAIDLFTLDVDTAGDPPVALHEFLITTDIETDANEAQLDITLSRFTGAFTIGSGGTALSNSAAIPPVNEKDADSVCTVRVGDTTQATGGTERLLGSYWVNNRVGLHVIFTPESRPTIRHDGTNDHALVLALGAAPPATTAFAGHIIFEELV